MINLTLPTPKNATHAHYQAIRFERAQQIIREGYSFDFDHELEVIFVTKPNRWATEYEIYANADNITGKAGCNCPDMLKTGQPCKHYIAAYILQEERKEEERDAALCAEHDALYGAAENDETGCDPFARY